MRLILLLACGQAPQDTGPVYTPWEWAVDEPGPFNVGYRSWVETYQSPLGERSVVMNLWYPTLDTTGEEVRYLGSLLDPQALGGATPAPPAHAGGYPVHVHSHGYMGWGGSSASLMHHFASQGWVVIAPDHTGNTLADHQDPLPTSQHIFRPLDISAALDALEALPESDPLSASVTRAVVLSGHSYGTYTAWASAGAQFDAQALLEACPSFETGACSELEMQTFLSGELSDPRVQVAIPMAGGIRREFFGDQGHATAHAAFLLLTGSQDGSSWQDGEFESVDGVQRTWVELQGGCHQTFAVGLCSTLDKDEGFRLVNGYAMGFSRYHLLGESAQLALIQGDQLLGEAAVVRVGD